MRDRSRGFLRWVWLLSSLRYICIHFDQRGSCTLLMNCNQFFTLVISLYIRERYRKDSGSESADSGAQATSQTRSRAIGPGRANNTWASVVSHPPPPTTVTHVHHQSPTHPHLFLGPPTCLSRRGRTAVVLWHTPSRLRGHPARLQPTTCRWTWVP